MRKYELKKHNMLKWLIGIFSKKSLVRNNCNLDDDEIRKIVERTDLKLTIKKALLLCPEISDTPLSMNESKIGGIGISIKRDTICKICGERLSMFLQIFKKDNLCDFIPKEFDVFEIYRCINPNCDGIYDECIDVDTRFRFSKIGDNELEYENHKVNSKLIPECRLNPIEIDDYPDYQDYDKPYVNTLIQEYPDCEDEISDIVADEFGPRFGSKIGGYPAWIQNSYDFHCESCKSKKELIFQLSSEEAMSKYENYTYKNDWSPHKVMIGDVGNIYAFICKNCDNQRITTYWDCT